MGSSVPNGTPSVKGPLHSQGVPCFWFSVMILLIAALLSAELPPQDLTVMTYNVRFATAPDGENAWPNRRDALKRLILKHDPDVLGVQEALDSQIVEFEALLKGHGRIGVGRDDGKRAGEFSALYTRSSRLSRVLSGTTWISANAAKPGSIGPGAQIPRVFTWGEFEFAGKRILIVNTHFDHVSEDARRLGALMIRDFCNARKELPAIVMGDFNCGPDSEPLKALRAGGLTVLKPKKGPWGTYNAFDPNNTGGEQIDHILVRGFTPISVEIDRTIENGRVPSDHFPVVARVRLERR